ncbi:MAG TPA: acyloxyacyl hydrolase [Acidobacteriaceae bacterium]|nr:acyloxyacyl hydrolase [Acidobacteriaceae bacterium]
MKARIFLLAFAAMLTAAIPALAQSPAADADAPAAAAFAGRPWEYGPFFQGGMGIGDRDQYKFTAAGFRLGKVITGEHLSGVFRGQFELAGEIMPWWQAFTPAPHLEQGTCGDNATGLTYPCQLAVGGGTFSGASLTPVILRWDFKPGRRIAPWFQAAGGLIYTTHKFPPDVLVPHGLPGGTSVWNFSPQGGIGIHYFIRPGRAITLSANGVHISSASLGDRNPGVNASVSFQIGYTFFGR